MCPNILLKQVFIKSDIWHVVASRFLATRVGPVKTDCEPLGSFFSNHLLFKVCWYMQFILSHLPPMLACNLLHLLSRIHKLKLICMPLLIEENKNSLVPMLQKQALSYAQLLELQVR